MTHPAAIEPNIYLNRIVETWDEKTQELPETERYEQSFKIRSKALETFRMLNNIVSQDHPKIGYKRRADTAIILLRELSERTTSTSAAQIDKDLQKIHASLASLEVPEKKHAFGSERAVYSCLERGFPPSSTLSERIHWPVAHKVADRKISPSELDFIVRAQVSEAGEDLGLTKPQVNLVGIFLADGLRKCAQPEADKSFVGKAVQWIKDNPPTISDYHP